MVCFDVFVIELRYVIDSKSLSLFHVILAMYQATNSLKLIVTRHIVIAVYDRYI